MFHPMCQTWPLLLLGGLVMPGLRHVSGIDIYTPSEVEAVNGTNVKLKCTFSSKHPVSAKSISVSWNFRPLKPGPEESVFYYQEVPYPTQQGRFKGHAVWSGDVSRQDVSITLHEVQPNFNGTYICQVRNLPDVHGNNGEIILKVVDKATVSEIGVLAAAVGGACGVILFLLLIFVVVRFYMKRRHTENDIELHSHELKDPSVCKPEEAVHLKVMTKEKEVGSSDDESEPSSGDDEEEGSGQEDDDDDDDDFGDDDDD